MRITLRHAEELGDDIVIEPYYRIGWRMNFSDYGVPVEIRSAVHTEDTSLAYSFSIPIACPDDINKLRKRTISVDRERTMMFRGMLEDKYVYSRKPIPAYISGANPNWDLLEADMKKTYAATKDCNVEILFRDVYTVNGDRGRLRKWVDMTKSIFQI